MTTESERQMQQVVTKLRADLMATNNAVLALLSALEADQRVTVLKTFAQLSEMQEQTAAQAPKPPAEDSLRALRDAHEGVYTKMQSVHKMRSAG